LDSAWLALVIAISDGDTLTVLDGQQQIKIRLAEIDAPEKKQAFGSRSKESLGHICFQAQAEIRPEKKDKYGRTVARVSCDGIDASIYQVEHGMAWYSRDYFKDPLFPPLEAEAQAAKRGLWVDPHPIPPWEWRRMRRH
jgi:micrococcal nuclease